LAKVEGRQAKESQPFQTRQPGVSNLFSQHGKANADYAGHGGRLQGSLRPSTARKSRVAWLFRSLGASGYTLMKTCPDCGREYSNDAELCAVDQTKLVVSKIESITIRRFTSFSLLKIVAIGFAISFFLFSVVIGILALIGLHTVYMDGGPVTGSAGLIEALLGGGIMAVAFTLIGWIGFMIGFGLFSRCGCLKLYYVPGDETSEPDIRSSENP
jgi:hypothetical protein